MAVRNKILIHIIILAVVFVGGDRASAAVSGATCAITSPADLAKACNAGQKITLRASWSGGTPPFGATFKTGGSAVGTVTTSDRQADFSISAAGLSDGGHTFTVSVIETAVPNSTGSPDAPAMGTVKIDLAAPVMDASIVSGAVVSPQAGHDQVVVRVTSDEDLGESPKIVISPGAWPAPSPETPETPPYRSNRYTISVPPGTAAGVYTVRVTGRDATEPAASRNEGSTSTAFTVDAAADGTVSITGSVPSSPSRSESLTLTGTVPRETQPQTVEVLDGATIVGTTRLAGGADTWTIALPTVAEGAHDYKARRVDPLGNVSALSQAFPVTVDRTPPGRPVIDPPKSPVNVATIRITGRGATDDPHRSGPVRITLRRESATIGSGTANADGTFTIDNVKLESGSNLILAQAADTTWDGSGNSAGNTSEFSAAVTVVLDQTAPVVIPGGVVISAPAANVSAPLTESSAAAPPAPDFEIAALADAGRPAPVPGQGLPGGSARSAFVPPLSGEESLEGLILPLAAISDPSPGQVSVWLVYRRFDEPATRFHRCPMPLGGRGFATSLPMPGAGFFYRFQLADRAGNVSWVPASGEFCHRPVRSSLLRCIDRAPLYEHPADADEWPVSALGLPPTERLCAYRVVEAPESVREALAARIATLPADRRPRLLSPAEEAAGAGDASWFEDIEKVRNGKADELSPERLELLILDIRNDIISDEIIDSLGPLCGSGAEGRIGEAVGFRRLHGRKNGE